MLFSGDVLQLSAGSVEPAPADFESLLLEGATATPVFGPTPEPVPAQTPPSNTLPARGGGVRVSESERSRARREALSDEERRARDEERARSIAAAISNQNREARSSPNHAQRRLEVIGLCLLVVTPPPPPFIPPVE